MNIVRLFPIFVSAFLLAAHFLRARMYPLVAASLAFPFLLLIPRRWAARLVQVILVLGAIEWVRTACMLAMIRRASGHPWMRMAIILGAVALVTAASGLVFRFETLRDRYKLGDDETDLEQ
ncbi:MAG: hypothetical protein QGG42_04535 [Phycisphaerae bacterium]|jgi:hypothetical protein|nr:hypothetical protein [Phycisphaerae bacterium]